MAYNPEAYRAAQQRRLQERQLEMQNDPGRIFLKALAQAAPQATFNALGQMAVGAADYELFGGRKKLDETIKLNKRKQDEVERTGKATRDLNVRKQDETEKAAREAERLSIKKEDRLLSTEKRKKVSDIIKSVDQGAGVVEGGLATFNKSQIDEFLKYAFAAIGNEEDPEVRTAAFRRLETRLSPLRSVTEAQLRDLRRRIRSGGGFRDLKTGKSNTQATRDRTRERENKQKNWTSRVQTWLNAARASGATSAEGLPENLKAERKSLESEFKLMKKRGYAPAALEGAGDFNFFKLESEQETKKREESGLVDVRNLELSATPTGANALLDTVSNNEGVIDTMAQGVAGHFPEGERETYMSKYNNKTPKEKLNLLKSDIAIIYKKEGGKDAAQSIFAKAFASFGEGISVKSSSTKEVPLDKFDRTTEMILKASPKKRKQIASAVASSIGGMQGLTDEGINNLTAQLMYDAELLIDYKTKLDFDKAAFLPEPAENVKAKRAAVRRHLESKSENTQLLNDLKANKELDESQISEVDNIYTTLSKEERQPVVGFTYDKEDLSDALIDAKITAEGVSMLQGDQTYYATQLSRFQNGSPDQKEVVVEEMMTKLATLRKQ